MNNDARFERIKKQIGGNREVMGYEPTFGMSKEIQMRITPVNKEQKRILSELEFALHMDSFGDKPGEFSDIIGKTLSFLEKELGKNGTLTTDACREAEKTLLPLSKAAKEYQLILCGHAHIDMNWMWSYNETVATTLSTFGTMLDLMDEYPDFRFSQSQTSVYKIVEDHDPEMKEKIQKRIREGRWEVTASEWVETDKNMPCGQSLLETIRRTREYFQTHWGLNPDELDIDFSPDTFGHSHFVPEIDNFGGVKYCYQCRGCDENYTLYRYRSPSGAEIMMYQEPYWYNSGITPHIGIGLPELTHRMCGLKTGMIVYGVGNHGGGVTRRDIENALDMQTWPVFPGIRFGTFKQFFAIAESIREKLPVVEHELNCLFTGCYTTQTRIKSANRKTEQKLLEAQTYSTMASLIGKADYPEKAYERAWQNTLFTHFHDILTGSCVRDSRDYAMGLYQTALADIETNENKALRVLASKIDSSSIPTEDEVIPLNQSYGAGVGYGIAGFGGVPNPERGIGLTRVYHLFNSTDTARTEVTELTVWDWVGDLSRIEVVDANGAPLDFALKDSEYQWFFDHRYLRFLVRITLPAFGYTTIILRQRETDRYPFRLYLPNWGRLSYENEVVLENENIRAVFNPATASLVSLVEKRTGEEKIDAKQYCGLMLIHSQNQQMTAWTIGRHLKAEPVSDVYQAEKIQYGDLRTGWRFSAHVLSSSVSLEVTLDKGAAGLQYHIEADWNELGGETIPLLVFACPLAYESPSVLCDIPMGSIVRNEVNHDIPALSYCSALPAKKAVTPMALITDTKYGYRSFQNRICCSLINTSTDPDPAPERGKHEMNLWLTLGDKTPEGMHAIASFVNRPFRWVSDNPHKGTLPMEGQLLKTGLGSCVISSVAKNSREEWEITLHEISGQESQVQITLPVSFKEAKLKDLTGKEIGKAGLSDKGQKVTASIQPYKIVMICLK